MLIKNKSDPTVQIKQILYRSDMSKTDKLLLTRILLESYEEFEFSIIDYSQYTKISISGIKKSLIHLDELGILIRLTKKGGRYRYIVECSNF